MIEEDFESTGDIRKDYMAYSEMMDRTPRKEIIYGIHHYIHRDPNESDENIDDDYASNYSTDGEMDQGKKDEQETRNAEQEVMKSELKLVKIEDFAELDDDDKEKLESEFIVRSLETRLNLVDILAISKAIATVPFNFKNVKLVSCGLSIKSLRLLLTAMSHRRNLRSFSLEMNPLTDENEMIDRELLKHTKVYNMVSSIKTAQLQSPEKASESESSQNDDKKGFTKVPPKSAPKRPVKIVERKDENKEELIQQMYYTKPIGPLFYTSVLHISLRGCELNDDHAQQISHYLADNNTLISLNLFGNRITDIGATAIAKALLSNQKLQYLSLAMNNITDISVKELCRSLCPVELFTEQEFFTLRENVYKSNYGALNIPREILTLSSTTNKHPIAQTPVPTEPPPLVLPALPSHLQPQIDPKKGNAKKLPTKQPAPTQTSSSSGLGVPTTITLLDWDNRCERFALTEVIEQPVVSITGRRDSKVGTRQIGIQKNSTKKGVAKVESAQQEVLIEEEKLAAPPIPVPLFKVPGNSTLKSLNLSLCRAITNESVKSLIAMLEVNNVLDRVNLSNTQITEEMMMEIANKLNETRNRQ